MWDHIFWACGVKKQLPSEMEDIARFELSR